MEIDVVDHRRMGFPSPLPKYPMDGFPVSREVSAAANWARLSDSVEAILKKHGVQWMTLYLTILASQYDRIKHTTIMVVATAQSDLNQWYLSLVDIRKLLESNGLDWLSVEFLDPAYPIEPYAFPLEPGHPFASNFQAVYDRVEGVLHKHRLGQTWSTLSVYRRGWTDKFEDSEPYLVITTTDAAPVEKILSELQDAVTSMQVDLHNVEIIEQSNESLFTTFNYRQVLRDDDFTGTMRVGGSLSLEKSTASATFGGSAWLTHQDGNKIRVGITNFHVLGMDSNSKEKITDHPTNLER